MTCVRFSCSNEVTTGPYPFEVGVITIPLELCRPCRNEFRRDAE